MSDDDTPAEADQDGAGASGAGETKPATKPSQRAIVIAVLVVAAIVAVVAIASGGGSDDGSDASGSTVDVRYELSGTATSADITIESDTGGSSQQQDVSVPLRNENGTTGLRLDFVAGDFVYLSAQNNGSGTLTCTIKADGLVISENTASGKYAIATCKGTA